MSQNAMQLYDYSRVSDGLVSDLRDDERDAVDGAIKMKAEALKADLLEQCVQMERERQ